MKLILQMNWTFIGSIVQSVQFVVVDSSTSSCSESLGDSECHSVNSNAFNWAKVGLRRQLDDVPGNFNSGHSFDVRSLKFSFIRKMDDFCSVHYYYPTNHYCSMKIIWKTFYPIYSLHTTEFHSFRWCYVWMIASFADNQCQPLWSIVHIFQCPQLVGTHVRHCSNSHNKFSLFYWCYYGRQSKSCTSSPTAIFGRHQFSGLKIELWKYGENCIEFEWNLMNKMIDAIELLFSDCGIALCRECWEKWFER